MQICEYANSQYEMRKCLLRFNDNSPSRFSAFAYFDSQTISASPRLCTLRVSRRRPQCWEYAEWLNSSQQSQLSQQSQRTAMAADETSETSETSETMIQPHCMCPALRTRGTRAPTGEAPRSCPVLRPPRRGCPTSEAPKLFPVLCMGI